MNSISKNIKNKVRLGWIIFAISLSIVLIGLATRFISSELAEKVHWVVSLGLLFLGISIAMLGKYLPAMRSAQSAARQMNDENDERNLSIRNAAGYIAFLASIITNYTALFIYSSVTRSVQGFDPLWLVLIFLSVFPLVVFIFFMLRYQKKF